LGGENFCRSAVTKFTTPTNVASECDLVENEISTRDVELASQYSLRLPACFSICAYSLGVKWLYVSRCRTSVFPPACLLPASPLLEAVMVEAGVAIDRGTNGFGKMDQCAGNEQTRPSSSVYLAGNAFHTGAN